MANGPTETINNQLEALHRNALRLGNLITRRALALPHSGVLVAASEEAEPAWNS